MNGLRIYINPAAMNMHSGQSVFYSRRADGPYYRWHYEEQLGHWQFSRVHPSDIMLRAFCVANWQALPATLKTRLGEHYLE